MDNFNHADDNVTDEEPEDEEEEEVDDLLKGREPAKDDRDPEHETEQDRDPDEDEGSEEGSHEEDDVAQGEDSREPQASGNMITVLIVPPHLRITSHILTKFEYTEAISIRAQQIAQFDNCMVDITGLTSPIDMAERELMMGKSPLKLKRERGIDLGPDGKLYRYIEEWCVREMQLPRHMVNISRFT